MKNIQLTALFLLMVLANAFGQAEHSLSREEKLYGLSLLRKEASYNFAFFHQVPDLHERRVFPGWQGLHRDRYNTGS